MVVLRLATFALRSDAPALPALEKNARLGGPARVASAIWNSAVPIRGVGWLAVFSASRRTPSG
jgi:hypothetical protein